MFGLFIGVKREKKASCLLWCCDYVKNNQLKLEQNYIIDIAVSRIG